MAAMTVAPEYKSRTPNVEAAVDAIDAYCGALDRYRRRNGSETKLEAVRRTLRRRRRKTLGWPRTWVRAGPGVRAVAASVAGMRDAVWPRSAKTGAISVVWRGPLVVAGLVIVAHLTLPSATDALARRVFRLLPNGAINRIDTARACVNVRPIVDANGMLVGVSSVRDCNTLRFFLSAPVSAQAAQSMHMAWRALEGEYRVSSHTISGLNVRGLGRAVLESLTGASRQTGGSAPLEIATKNLLGHPGSLSALQKIRSIYDTLTYTARQLGDNRERDRFVAENIPCVRGTEGTEFGYPLAGQLCSLFLFHKSADDLDWAERCVWTAAANKLWQVTGAATSPAKTTEAKMSQVRIRSRAIICLRYLSGKFGWDAKELTKYESKVKAFDAPMGALRDMGNTEALSVDLLRTAPGLKFAYHDELKLARGVLGSGPIRLTVSGTVQQQTQEAVLAAARRIEARLAPGQCLAVCSRSQTPVDLVAVLAEIEGDELLIRQLVTNRHYLWSGPLEHKDGAYHRAPTTRAVGSTNKAWLIPLFVSKEYGELCNLVPIGASRGGASFMRTDAVCTEYGMITVRNATASSENPAFADGVWRLGVSPTRAYFDQIGYDIAPELTASQFVGGLVLGHQVTAAPIVLVRNMAALYRGFTGEEPVSSLPRLIAGHGPVDRLDWRKTGLTTEDIRRAGDILGTPITHSQGTLRTLAPVLKRNGCTNPIGKTGTSESTAQKASRDKIIVAAFDCGGRRYVAFGLIGSSSVTMPLGNIYTSDVVALIDAMLSVR